MPQDKAATLPRNMARAVLAIITGLLGLWLLVFGGYLLSLGGSAYYVIAGIGLIGAGVLLWRGNSAGLLIYALVLAGTIIWALWEVGLDFWQLAPRGDILAILGVLLILPWVTRGLEPRARLTSGGGLALALALVGSGVVAVIALF